MQLSTHSRQESDRCWDYCVGIPLPCRWTRFLVKLCVAIGGEEVLSEKGLFGLTNMLESQSKRMQSSLHDPYRHP